MHPRHAITLMCIENQIVIIKNGIKLAVEFSEYNHFNMKFVLFLVFRD